VETHAPCVEKPVAEVIAPVLLLVVKLKLRVEPATVPV